MSKQNLKFYYRISDQSYEKSKLIGATKKVCYENFIQAICLDGCYKPRLSEGHELHVIADNCEESLSFVDATVKTSLGNAGSMLAAIELAIEQNDDDDIIYFCEDDYLHRPNVTFLMQEIADRTDYFTLFDHPDKYTHCYDFGETSKVIRTASSHWRFTVSTCMTFGTTRKVLKGDYELWCSKLQGNHPPDHFIFTELGQQGRKLAVSIPGTACHTDLTFHGAIGSVMIEKWAIDMMIAEMEKDVAVGLGHLLEGRSGWDRLVMLDVIKHIS